MRFSASFPITASNVTQEKCNMFWGVIGSQAREVTTANPSPLVRSWSQTLGKSSSLFLYECLHKRYLTSEVQFFLLIIGGFHCSHLIRCQKVHWGQNQVLLQIYLHLWVGHLTHSTCWVNILFWRLPCPILADQLPLGVSSPKCHKVSAERTCTHTI